MSDLLIVETVDTMFVTVGEQGPPGRDGSGGTGGGNYLALTFAATLELLINHNFGRRPVVQVLSPGSLEVLADVAHPSINQVRLSFVALQAGQAVLTA